MIDGGRLLDDLRALARFGRCGTGVERIAYTPEDMAARAWLCERMAAAGLEARIDGTGNVYGRMPGVARALLVGSHTDSVPRGGWLDGSLGVLCGLEVARALIEDGAPGAVGVDVISFAEEEGHYLGNAGSLAFCRELPASERARSRNAVGRSLADALAAAGLGGRGEAHVDPARHIAFLEAHIEQGPRLEAEGTRIGIVTGIVGIRRVRVALVGQADHAGTTPMGLRRDAAAALFRLARDVTARFEGRRGPDTVWNFGQVTVEPGAGNVVPGRAELLIEFRDLSEERLDAMESDVEAVVASMDGAGGVAAAMTRVMTVPPAEMDARLGRVIESAAAAAGAGSRWMPSGAGHDAAVMRNHVPSAMLFIPSIGGRSHDVSEDSHEEDIVLGLEVLARTVRKLIE